MIRRALFLLALLIWSPVSASVAHAQDKIALGAVVEHGLFDGEHLRWTQEAAVAPHRRGGLISAANVPSFVPRINGVTADAYGDFANNRYWQRGSGILTLSQFLAVTRNSSSWCADTSGNYVTVGANAACRTNAGLQVWESRTNILLQSATLTNAAWTKFATTVTGGQADPTGGTSASLVVPSAANTAHEIYNPLTGTAAVYTFSSLVKSAGYNFAQLYGATGPGAGTRYAVVFNLSTGAVTQTTTEGTPTNTSASATVLGNGWVLLSVSMTTTTDANSTVFVLAATPTGTPTQSATLDPIFTGDGTSGIVVWNAQLEPGTFASPPILTTSAAVQRFADVMTLRNPLAFGSAVSAVTVGIPAAPASSSTNQALLSIDSDINNRLQLSRDSTTSVTRETFLVAGVTTQANGAATWATGASGKLAASWTSGAQTAVFNGGGAYSPVTPGTGFPTLNTVHLGIRQDAALFWDGTISSVAIWPNNAFPTSVLQTAENDNGPPIRLGDTPKRNLWAANDNHAEKLRVGTRQ